MPALLTLRYADRPARRFVLEEGTRHLVGRLETCDVQVGDTRVSRRHAALEAGPAGWIVADLESKNGVAVDGRPVRGGALLAPRCWLSLGGVLARFEVVSEADRRAAADRERDRWQSTLGFGERLDPAAGLPILLRQVLDSVVKLAGAERGFVLLAGDDGELEVAATAGLEAEVLASEEFAGSAGAVERALAEGRPVVACDARGDFDLGRRPSIVEGGIRALACVPLQILGRKIGAIYADSRCPGSAFTELDLEILEALAGQAALAIAVARLSHEAAGLAGEVPTSWDAAEVPVDLGPWPDLLPVYEPRPGSRTGAWRHLPNAGEGSTDESALKA